jgi:hypothetical protein
MITAYFFVRPGLFEKEYVTSLETRSTWTAANLEGFEKDKPVENRNLGKVQTALEKKFGPSEYFAVYNKKNVPVYKHTLDRESELFYSLGRDLETGKLSPADSPLVRFYNQKKFYIFINEIGDETLALSWSFQLSRRNMLRLFLEILLIVLVSIAAGSVFHVVLYRSGAIPAPAEHQVIRVGGDTGSRIKDVEKKADEIRVYASDNLRNYVYDLFISISSSHGPDSISLYIMNRESSRMSKSFEMKGRSFVTMDSPDLDVIDTDNEIGSELKQASTLVLSNGNRIILPILFRNNLLGAVNIIRGIPFKGLEIKEIKTLFGDIARFLSEYILFNDVVVDPETGLYGNFYFKLKYEEILKQSRKGGAAFAAFAIALFREKDVDSGMLREIVRGLSRGLMEKIGEDDIITLHDASLSLLMPGADSEKALAAAEAMIKRLSGLTVKTETARMQLRPYIGFTVAGMPGVSDPLGAARENLNYAILSETSTIEYSRIRSI